MKRISEQLEVVSNRKLDGDSNLYLLSFFSPVIALTAKPGQFVEIGFPESILPKPFSIHQVHDFGIVEILYAVVGKGTEALSRKNEGDEIIVTGPLGNGFPKLTEGPVYIIGGGTGIAPCLFLSQSLKDVEHHLYLGARTVSLLPTASRFPNAWFATDDGSKGFKGTVTELMVSKLLTPGVICACGPKPMLKAIHSQFKGWDKSMYFSLENYMACGVGACLGCSIITDGAKRVCVDGPVFEATEVINAL